jgi:hypothetical protein
MGGDTRFSVSSHRARAAFDSGDRGAWVMIDLAVLDR